MIEDPRFPTAPNITSPVDFISNIGWGAIKVPGIARDSICNSVFFFFKMLFAMEEFRNLDRDIENNSKRWRKFVEAEVLGRYL